MKMDRNTIIILIISLIFLMALFTSFIYFFFTNNSQSDTDLKNTNVEILKRDRDMENAEPGQGNN
jgi:flagellar basal body-associated protein FliL